MNLESLGFDDALKQYAEEHQLTSFEIGRIVAQHKDRYDVITSAGALQCEVTGNLRFAADTNEDLPAVGDWVAIMAYDDDKGLIHAIYPRKTILKRRSAGNQTSIQVIATNIDFAMIVQALDRDFNLSRMERYLVLCHEAGIKPIIVLTKFDLLTDQERTKFKEEVVRRVGDVLIVQASNQVEDGYKALEDVMLSGQTYCLLGSSGVGKSTITNHLAGDESMKTNAVSDAVKKGRHTTTHRELIVLPNGSMIIDNPGMREVGITDAGAGLESTFEEIATLAKQCRYADCTHTTENQCAVLDALEEGMLDADIYDNFIKLRKEKEFFETSHAEKRRKDKKMGKMFKTHIRMKRENKY